MHTLVIWLSDHSLLMLLMLGTVFTFVWQRCCKDRLGIHWGASAGIAAAHTVFGVFSVSVFAVLETLNLDNWGNLSLFGGVFFMPLFYWCIAEFGKQKLADVFDVFTICLMFTLLCARINCILTGCCQGSMIPGTKDLRWPTRELELIFYVVLLFWLGRKVKKSENPGTIYPVYMISYGIFRFIDECFRESDHLLGIIHVSHIWALISLGLGLSIYAEQKAKAKKKIRR